MVLLVIEKIPCTHKHEKENSKNMIRLHNDYNRGACKKILE